jgi:hypothetical protein
VPERFFVKFPGKNLAKNSENIFRENPGKIFDEIVLGKIW